MQIQSLGWEDLLEEETATPLVFLLENPMDRGAWHAIVPRVAKSGTHLSTHTHMHILQGEVELLTLAFKVFH